MDERPGIAIRPERPDDLPAVTRVNDAAFGRTNEGRLVDLLRERGALTVSLVAFDEAGVVGHIAFSPLTTQPLVSDANLAALGPVAVLPEFQRRGIGGRLVRAGLEACRELGCDAVFLVGHAEYYPRFGFVRADEYGIACEFEVTPEVWMVAELVPGTLARLKGTTAFFQSAFCEMQ